MRELALDRAPSLSSRGLAAVLSRTLRAWTDARQPQGQDLARLRRFNDLLPLDPLPRCAARWPDTDVPGDWVAPTGVIPGDGVLLYLHGGGFVFGSPRSHRGLAYRLSAASGLAAFVPYYRLAPEHPFPAAADDVLAAYRVLLDRGVSPERIALAGDSVGGHLVASVLVDAVREGLPLPAAAVMMSPALDCTGAGLAARDAVRRDPMLSHTFGTGCGLAYLGSTPSSHPRLDVLGAAKVGWPPLLIQVGDTEVLLGDAQRMHRSATGAGVACELQVWPGQVHVFQAFARFVPEARAAITEVGGFLRRHVPVSS
ncbi:MAG TPA: alpha/beta hydrolase [Pseudonocardia sp.]|nr:alpha/beta hydrolase [Pseudonocardia sp.]